MSETAELLERFRRGPELLASALTGAAGPELDFAEPGKWSVRQIVAHVSDADLVAADRFRRIIAEDNPTLIGYDQDAWAKNLDYAKRKPSQALETFRRIRTETYELLKEVPESAWERAGMHSERGPLTLRDLLKICAEHAEDHTREIRNVREKWKEQRART